MAGKPSRPKAPAGEPAPSASELIEFDDFQSVELQIAVENMTSHTKIADGTSKGPRVDLVELAERGFTVNLPRASCASGHNLMIEIAVIQPPSKRMKFSATTKVELVEKNSEVKGNKEPERVELSLIQFEEEAWERLKTLFTSRQNEIEDFFKAARGY